MANLRNHEIMETYRSVVDANHVFHVTKDNCVVRTTGPRGGDAKILHVTERGVFNFSGQGRRATAAEFLPRLERMEKVS